MLGLLLIDCHPLILFSWILFENAVASSEGGLEILEYAAPVIFVLNIMRNSAIIGGVYVSDFARSIFNSTTICNNTCSKEGGGFMVSNAAYVDLQDSHVQHNWAFSNGGGILFEISSSGTVRVSTISLNTARFKEGGLCIT